MDINVSVVDGNNIVCQVTPTPQEIIIIDRGVAGVGIASITPVTVDTLQYLRITYTNGVVQDVGPLTSTAYFGETPIQIVGNTISLTTVPVNLGGTGQTTANAGFNALAPSQTGNSGKFLTTDGTNASWSVNPLGTVTSVDASGGTTGLTFSGGPITTSGTLTLAGILGIVNGGTGASTAAGAPFALKGANSDITSLSGITGAIGTADYVQFDTTYATTLGVGQLGWDGNNTLGLGMAGGNVVQKIGEDEFYYIKASSAITKGQVIMFTGAVGASGVVAGAPATGVTDGSYIMGIAAENIALNAFGLVQFQGTLKGFDTSAFTDGAILWFDPAVTGGLTATKPSAPNIKVQMAAVIHAGNGGSGSALIRVNAGSVLGGTDSNVQFGTLSANNLIQYNGTYWTNIVGPTSAIVGISDSQTLTNKTISGASNTLSSIGNSSLVNSSITINGNSVSLGGSTTVTATATNALTIGTGLSGTSYNGSTAVTISNTGVLSFSGGTTGLTPSSATNGAITLAGTLAIANGGTGQTTANAAFNALAPSQTGNSGKFLTTDGTNTSWATNPLGTVTSVSGTGTVNGLTLTGTVTTSGSLTLGGTLDLSSPPAIGGTTPSTGKFTNVTTPTIGSASGASLVFQTNGGTTAVTIDTAQNVGVGVTPSAWGSGYSAFQFGKAASLWTPTTNSGGLYQSLNLYFDGTNRKYLTNDYATEYVQASGQHIWKIAASGTAGSAITFTQAMTLDAGGNVAIGSTTVYQGISGTETTVSLKGASSTYAASFTVTNNAATATGYFSSANNGNIYVGAKSNTNFCLVTNDTERARIDSSGNFLIGSSTASALLYRYSSSTTFTGTAIRAEVNTAAGTGWLLFQGVNTATDCFRVYGNGNVQNTNNSYGAISDIKLKENITDATPKLADLMQVKIRNYNLKSDPEHKQLGVIAQELEQIFPAMIEESPDKDAEGNNLGTTTKSVKYSVFVPVLIKSLQELKAEFDAYKASHP